MQEATEAKQTEVTNQSTVGTVVTTTTQEGENAQPISKKFCTECGKEVSAEAKFCPFCGNKLM